MRHAFKSLACIFGCAAILACVRPAGAVDLAVAIGPNPYAGTCSQMITATPPLTMTGSITGGSPNQTMAYQFRVTVPATQKTPQVVWGPIVRSTRLNASGAASVKWSFPPPTSGQFKGEFAVLSGNSWSSSRPVDFSATCTSWLPPNRPGIPAARTVVANVVIVGKPAECASYYLAVKAADGTTRTVQTIPVGADRCSFAMTGPFPAPVDVLVGFGGSPRGWLLARKHFAPQDIDQALIVEFALQKSDIESKTGKGAMSDDWTK
ncbi:MAG: hypothetical protein JO293_01840 [Candidatus Eremiobacteraeota bacterium]|nr:hypothetical protein [Candidatus Eremiobacteraeota bacterium]